MYDIVSTNLKNQISSLLGIVYTCSSTQSLNVTSDSDCDKLQENGWNSIIVNEGLCNNMKDDLFISNNPCLESIVINQNSLQNLNSLVISNNLQLSSIVIAGGQVWDSSHQTYYAPFENVKSVELSSIF